MIVNQPQNVQAFVGPSGNCLQNPGLETGAVPPWTNSDESPFTAVAGAVVNTDPTGGGPHTGSWYVWIYPKQTTGFGVARQDFPVPIPVTSITAFSVWYRAGFIVSASTLRAEYADGTHDDIPVVTDNLNTWHQTDGLAALNAAKNLATVYLIADIAWNTYWDDAILTAPTRTPRGLLLVYPSQS